MKLSNTQRKIYEEVTATLAILKKYSTFEEFFDNSKYEQSTFTTAYNCNNKCNSSEKYQTFDAENWERMKKKFYTARDENIIMVLAKTETVNALVKAGLIEIVKPAPYRGCAETIKVI